MPKPVFIHIGPDGSADDALVQLFDANGYKTACHLGGELATDILFAQARDQRPLRQRPGIRLFAGLWRAAPHWRPPQEAWRCFAYLAKRISHARFILTLPDPDTWVCERIMRDEGKLARCHAFHRNVPELDLPDLWRADLRAHQHAVDDYFGDDPRLIRIDLTSDSPATLAKHIDPLLPMSEIPFDKWPDQRDQQVEAALLALYDRALEPHVAPDDWAQDVAQFCLQGVDSKAEGGIAGLSGFACDWDGGASVLNQKGGTRQIAVVTPEGAAPMALGPDDRHFKVVRAEGVINDILRLGRRDPVWIDMEDSRWMGSPQGEPLDRPVLCHNRRAGAVNPVLWPLPDQHAIGLSGFDPAAPADPVSFDDKEDRIVWRGMISGNEMRDSTRPGPASHVWLAKLLDAGQDADARDAAWDGLQRTSRLHFVRRFFDHPDFDIGVVMAFAYRHFAQDPLLAPYCGPRRGRPFFQRFRYQLCLSGYDHGSNFISALDSNSVLFAEDDGWQVFYSGRFKPWVHFIPIARYGNDILEKLDWARSNPDACKAMSCAARAEAAHLRDPHARRMVMTHILDGLAQSR
ncbi:glycosyl transferase family 90 [Paracoccus sp. JM45]|uniref:glycosyl transferase family 90 n=1 Tax=Paracoccus sp. JM45 TaxID=2283626 RepID=UPI000E6B9C98|nr:glycosyl transferase family 90 [Paracoccus sp. JM45]RJE80377.1 hypothetical protein DWB67_05710 [Paracoccus sp. JM45]